MPELLFVFHPVFVDGGNLSMGDLHEPRYLDPHLSCQRARRHATDHLTEFGYSPEQACMTPCAAPIEGRLSGVVDIPGFWSRICIPTAVFDVGVRPSAQGPTRIGPGMGVRRAGS